VGIGLVGAGSFGQSVLLPALQKAGDSDPVAIATVDGMTARRIGEQYGFRIATSDADEIIHNPDVNAVFVLTRHDLHASLVTRALEAGKYVFTEKPLALSAEELEQVVRARHGAPGDAMVGFNRRFAPLVEKIESHFQDRTHPLVMQYRINAGFIPSDHWVHDPVEGGGRILGEVCHFVDLLQHLAGAPPQRVFAESIAGDTRYRGDDNVVLTLHFADGSVATVVYTAMGDSRIPKEYLEVFGEGRGAILEDFRTLSLTRDGKTRKARSANQDKGFEEEMRRFLSAVRTGGPVPIPFEQSLATTRATLAALASLRSGQPQPVDPGPAGPE
jgi:predicted dehydrogenase